ncbi:YbaN family protein [Anaerosphaera multitolerans]|uniref:DUF454 domain-containing protein n=1 Tax=Anaerosphaera multitolerans TaxID=2487351 RepID=A0A437S604_9FIRM|nr:YbaN family protein [Anaerosphaera multitolerans]RVU54429.1 DUF454 domain-containing protein [Anaerosphaera multitolerans]
MKYIFITLGFVFMGIGSVGTFIPFLPTVPFLLLATLCFAKGSDRFHRWFLQTNLYQQYVDGIITRKGLSIKKKIKTLLTVSLLLLICFLLVKNLHGRICIILVLLGHYYYFIFRVKTIKGDEL